jgi:voltage-gated potassium channel
MKSENSQQSTTTAEPSAPEALALGALGRVLAAQDFGALYDSAKRELRSAIAKDPIDSLVVTCLGGAWLFYVAEKDENEKVTSFWDALVFVTTSLSVGYANVFAVTPAGKAIAAALNTIGPAMAAKALEAPAAERDTHNQESVDAQRQLIERIDALVGRLDRLATEREATANP